LTFFVYRIASWCQFHQHSTSSFCALGSQKRKKNWWFDCLFVLFGSSLVKAAHRTLMKLPSDHFCRSYSNIYISKKCDVFSSLSLSQTVMFCRKRKILNISLLLHTRTRIIPLFLIPSLSFYLSLSSSSFSPLSHSLYISFNHSLPSFSLSPF